METLLLFLHIIELMQYIQASSKCGLRVQVKGEIRNSKKVCLLFKDPLLSHALEKILLLLLVFYYMHYYINSILLVLFLLYY